MNRDTESKLASLQSRLELIERNYDTIPVLFCTQETREDYVIDNRGLYSGKVLCGTQELQDFSKAHFTTAVIIDNLIYGRC